MLASVHTPGECHYRRTVDRSGTGQKMCALRDFLSRNKRESSCDTLFQEVLPALRFNFSMRVVRLMPKRAAALWWTPCSLSRASAMRRSSI